MTIAKAKIDQAKGVDLLSLLRAKGIELKKNGKGYVGRCPFHADKHPSLSISPSENLFQCFGCGAAGDAIRFIEMFDGVDFKEAVARLTGNGDRPRASGKSLPPKSDPPRGLTVTEGKLLSRVVAHYQHALFEDGRGIAYLKDERGIAGIQSLKDFGAGYVNGTLLEILPEDEEILKALKKIGILNARGREVFYNCVVFPLYGAGGGIENLYGRNIDPASAGGGAGEGIKHRYLPGPRRGLVNRQAVTRGQSVILTESVIDALTLYDQGFKNAIPLYGVNGCTGDHLALLAGKIKTAYLVFDADEAGLRAVDAVSSRLKEKGIASVPVSLPVKDVNLYFKRHGPEAFEALVKAANPGSIEHSETLDHRRQRLYKETAHGFIAGFGERQYAVKGIQRGETQLKVTVKASAAVEEGERPFELTTIDLYSSRSRAWFAKLCADLFGAAEELVREDISRLLVLVEDYRPRQREPRIAEPSRAEKDAATAFLKNPGLFEEILADLETLGVVGENTNKIVCYLAAVSRKLPKPLSVLIQSRSSAGKSTLQNAILSLVPEEDYESYTRVTDQALFYKKEEALVHKILAIEEDAGMGGAAYSIRNIQSAGKITVAATGKNPGTGKMETEDYTVKGPVAVMLTTTAAEQDQETASRFIVLSIDESAEMTRAIHAKQRQARTLQGLVQKTRADAVRGKHHTAQRLLKPVAVVNDFDAYLSYPTGNLVTRRDHDKYLGLIEAVAYLHQYQRETKTVAVDGRPVAYIEVTLEDIAAANRLADEILGRSLDELARPSRTLLEAVWAMVKALSADRKVPVDQVFFTRRMIREYIGWTDWQIKTHIRQLEALEYLRVRIGAQGKQYSYALHYNGQGETGRRFYLNLTPVEEIRRRMEAEKEGK